ncbi:cation transporter [Hujiaoplasma nucleasis]|uniref:Cation transporter n=1 Tax=Hujiaoplasma nucleasis TaxID=2725268 RepID=A0A7L6N1E3_9MOLU|nr:cation diffusion facilitator family transporter [Hujiaoplasma nucleasis]QLY40076.1 cation transporter [Hujiaoplasma nucleasis]
MKKVEEKIIKKNTFLTIIMNTLLAIAKLFGGILGGSAVLVADAVNSIGDIATNIVVFVSAKFSKKEKDETHPYGHEKFDSMISIFLGFALLITAYQLGKDAVERFIDIVIEGLPFSTPMWYTWFIAIVTIIVKEMLFRITKIDAKKAKSQALMAQAWDHRSDTIVSFGAIIGIVGAIYGVGFLDPLASFVIGVFIFRLGLKIIKTGVSQVVDASADDEQIVKIKEIVHENDKVRRIDEIKTRMFGISFYVDLEIALDAHLSLEEAHAIAESIHDRIEEQMPDVIHCMIHVNPCEEKNKNIGKKK